MQSRPRSQGRIWYLRRWNGWKWCVCFILFHVMFCSHVMFLQCKFLTKQTLFCLKFQQSSFQSGSPISLSTFWREICFLHLPNQVLVSGILGFGWLKLVKVLWFKGVKCGCGILKWFIFANNLWNDDWLLRYFMQHMFFCAMSQPLLCRSSVNPK